MTDKVANLSEVRDEPDEEVVELIEQWLDDAKNGRIRGIVLMTKLNNGTRYAFEGMDDFDAAGLLNQAAFMCRHNVHMESVPTPREEEEDDGRDEEE